MVVGREGWARFRVLVCWLFAPIRNEQGALGGGLLSADLAAEKPSLLGWGTCFVEGESERDHGGACEGARGEVTPRDSPNHGPGGGKVVLLRLPNW